MPSPVELLPLLLLLTLSASQHPSYLQDSPGLTETEDPSDAEETAKLTKEWEDQMKDFTPSDLVTFELGPRNQEDFWEVIETVPSRVRGAFFVSSQETRDIDLTILGPDGAVAYRSTRRKEGIFYFDATERGQYMFMFANNKFVEKVQITFAMHTGESSTAPLDKEHITPVEGGLLEVVKGIKDFQMEQQFAQLRQESHYKTVQNANRNLFWFSILECLGIIAVSTWQVYYIKKIMDHRRMI